MKSRTNDELCWRKICRLTGGRFLDYENIEDPAAGRILEQGSRVTSRVIRTGFVLE